MALTEDLEQNVQSDPVPAHVLMSGELGREEGRKGRLSQTVPIPEGRGSELSSKGHLRNSINWDNTGGSHHDGVTQLHCPARRVRAQVEVSGEERGKE